MKIDIPQSEKHNTVKLIVSLPDRIEVMAFDESHTQVEISDEATAIQARFCDARGHIDENTDPVTIMAQEPKEEPKEESKWDNAPTFVAKRGKSEAKAVEPKPEPKPEAKPEPKPEAKPEPKAEAKPEPKAEAKVEPKRTNAPSFDLKK